MRGVYGNVVAGPVFREIADKIYSNRLEMQTLLAQADTVHRMPVSFGGNRADLLTVMDRLDIPAVAHGEGEWASTQATDSTVVINERNVPPAGTGMVPNVLGMGLRDAMYILENQGLRVRLSGSGMVRRQSPAPGTRSMKGTTVTLELAI
jgi:cell division protein FtsI (penicillin-binding protein 3)